MNVCLSLCSMLLNQFRTALVFFHWFKLRWLVMVVFTRSRICLVILPISDLAGLIRRQVGLLAKVGLVVLEGYEGFSFGGGVNSVV